MIECSSLENYRISDGSVGLNPTPSSKEWKNILNFEMYSVSSCGLIRNNKTMKILKQNVSNGYLGVTVKPFGRNGKSIRFRTHVEVAKAFVSGMLDTLEVNHIDGNKLNNTSSNLEWVSRSRNVKHAYDNGLKLPLRGIDHGSSILTAEDVEFIRNSDMYSSRDLARIYSCCHRTICDVRNYKTYK